MIFILSFIIISNLILLQFQLTQYINTMNQLQSEQGIQLSKLQQSKIQQNNKLNIIRNILILAFVLIIGIIIGSFTSKDPNTSISTNQNPSKIAIQNPSPIKSTSTSDCAPDPYKTVNLMPYRPDGFYANAQQIEKLIKQYNVATIIEVGTYMGRSALHMASLIPENGKVYAVDTFSGQPTQVFKYNPLLLQTLYDQFLSNVIHDNMTHKIVPVRMTSEQAAQKLNVYPHMIYIDATHTYDEAKKDLKLWYPFVKDHGVICGDDYIWIGSDGVGRAVQQFAKQNGLKTYNNGLFWKIYKQ